MLIQNGNIVKLHSVERGDIRIRDGKIAEIGEKLTPELGEEIYDANGNYVTAGFVDIHTHGGYGADFMDCSFDAFEKALTFHLDNGTTTVVPTSCTAPQEQIVGFLAFAKEYMQSLTHDIFDANVYVFTPKGKVIELPEGSTPLDFAYKIHSGVGDSAVGAKVNNSLVPLSTKLKTGDVVEIRTSSASKGPNEDWLNLVKTSNAKNHIRKFLIKKNQEFMRSDAIDKAKITLIDAFKEHGLTEKDIPEYIDEKFVNKFSYTTIDDFLYGLSQKNPPITAVIDALNIRDKVDKQAIIESYVKKNSNRGNESKNQSVIVSGVDNVKIQLAPCCTPVPGDDVVGYITRGKGIKVHRKDCPNIQNEINRTISVEWNPRSMLTTFTAHIQIEANDRPNLVVDVMNTLSTLKITCTKFSAKILSNKITSMFDMSILVTSNKRLYDVFAEIKAIDGVYEVRRVIK